MNLTTSSYLWDLKSSFIVFEIGNFFHLFNCILISIEFCHNEGVQAVYIPIRSKWIQFNGSNERFNEKQRKKCSLVSLFSCFSFRSVVQQHIHWFLFLFLIDQDIADPLTLFFPFYSSYSRKSQQIQSFWTTFPTTTHLMSEKTKKPTAKQDIIAGGTTGGMKFLIFLC